MNYFVTGGSRGLGTGIVLDAIKEGHNVAFTYVRSKDKAEDVVKRAADINPDAMCRCYQLDVKNSDQVDEVANQVLDDFDSIEVIVNNAGVSMDNLVVSMSNEEWDEVIATNLSGPFYVCRSFLTAMLGNRFGRIINISSISAGGGSGQANYAAAKAGLHGLTQTLAKEYGRKGITANVIAPGFFETDMTQDQLADHLRSFWNSYCPMPKGRTGRMDELSGVVNFLASEAGGFINGQIISVTGGLDWGP